MLFIKTQPLSNFIAVAVDSEKSVQYAAVFLTT